MSLSAETETLLVLVAPGIGARVSDSKEAEMCEIRSLFPVSIGACHSQAHEVGRERDRAVERPDGARAERRLKPEFYEVAAAVPIRWVLWPVTLAGTDDCAIWDEGRVADRCGDLTHQPIVLKHPRDKGDDD